MQIKLKYEKNNEWISPEGFRLCNSVLASVFKLKQHIEYVMSVRFRNPRQKGYMKVVLHRRSIWGIWYYQLAVKEWDDCFLGSNIDQFLDSKFGTARDKKHTVWVKFTQKP